MAFDLGSGHGHSSLRLSFHEGLGVRNDPVLDNKGFSLTARFQRLEELGDRAKKLLAPAEAVQFWVKGLWTLADSIRSEGAARHKFHEQGSIECRAVERVCAEVAKEIPRLSIFLSSLFAESLGILGYRDKSLLKLLGESARERRAVLTPSQIKRFLWSMSQLDVNDTSFVAMLVKSALAADRQDRLTESSRSRIAIALAHLQPESVRLFLRPDFLDDTECTIQAWMEKHHALLITKAVTHRDKFERRQEVSSLERDSERNSFELAGEAALRRFLDGRNVEYGLHAQFNIAGIFPDLVVYLGDPDRTVAIELDGYQFHFSWGPDGGVRFGRDLVRQQVLEAHEVEVAHITSHDWNETHSDALFSKVLGL